MRPVLSFQPDGDHPNSTLPRLHLLHGTLPREPVCTENLTPFLKLLPCKGKAGISTLLDGHKLFDASWQSMSIDVRPVCPEGSPCSLEIEQTVDMVIDIERFKRYRGQRPPFEPRLALSDDDDDDDDDAQIIQSQSLCWSTNWSATRPNRTLPMRPATPSTISWSRPGA